MNISIGFQRIGTLSFSPCLATNGSSGYDLYAAMTRPRTLGPGERVQFLTGIRVAIPAGYEGQIRSRSGLAAYHGIHVLNSPGTIDSDYRGEVQVLLFNSGSRNVTITPGQRIAQIVFAPVCRVEWVEIPGAPTMFEATTRGEGGFGSTGS